jgi:holdfast attachment protein HfaA
MVATSHIPYAATVLGACASLALAGAAAAQSASTNSSSYNAGYGRTSDQENRPVQADTRDANGNRVIIDGVIQTGANQSSITFGGGASSTSSGAGAGGATAIGNNLTVITQGNWNTVIVNSTQTNTGTVTAQTGAQPTGGGGGG